MGHAGGESRAEVADELARSALLWMLAGSGGDHDMGGSLYSGRAGILLALHAARSRFDIPGTDSFLEPASRGCSTTSRSSRTRRSTSASQARRMRSTGSVGQQTPGGHSAMSACVSETVVGATCSSSSLATQGSAWGRSTSVTRSSRSGRSPRTSTTWTRTAHGVNWAVRPTPPRSHHVAHGTLRHRPCAGRPWAGRWVVRTCSSWPWRAPRTWWAATRQTMAGFLVPHSDPQHRPDLIERLQPGVVQRTSRRRAGLPPAR